MGGQDGIQNRMEATTAAVAIVAVKSIVKGWCHRFLHNNGIKEKEEEEEEAMMLLTWA